MRLLIFLLSVQWMAIKCQDSDMNQSPLKPESSTWVMPECSPAVPSQAHVVIITDKYDYRTPSVEELAILRNLAERLQTPNIKIQIHFLSSFGSNILQQIKDTQALGKLSYVIYGKTLSKCINSELWKAFPQKEGTKGPVHRTLIILPNYPLFHVKDKASQLKKAGVEIFALAFRKSLEAELEDFVSSPPDTHMYEWMKTVEPDHVISELAKHVCLGIENNQLPAKKSLLSQVRLVDGSHTCEGRVEVFYNNIWSVVSYAQWDRPSADVTCRQLGCGPSLEALQGGHFGSVPGHVLKRVACSGHEHDLSHCVIGVWGEEDPKNKQQSAEVICLPSGLGSVTLVDGSSSCDGIVEVTVNKTRGRVCMWNFGPREAAVICTQLRCGAVQQVQEYRNGMGPNFWTVEKIFCTGEEKDLSECSLSLWSPEPCYLNVHAGIVCTGAGLTGAQP